jgi:hypothetical protein
MRLALSVLAACGLACLTACGSGFSGGSNSSAPDTVLLMPASGQTNDFFVTPGGTAPLAISAIAYKGSGALDDVVPDVTYTWAARFVNPLTDPTSVSTYPVSGSAPSSFKTCPAMPSITPPVPILVPGTTGTLSTFYTGYTELAANKTANEVFIGPVPGETASAYCLVVQATSVPGGVVGTATVVVSASP